MKDKMERLVVLPFTAGCVSTSSIAVSEKPHPQSGTQRRPKNESAANSFSSIGVKEPEHTLTSENMRSSFKFLTLPKPNISIGLQRLAKSLKTVSQLFVFREEMQEVEMDMEIGFPTDVKHVTHIGLDGYATTNPTTLDSDHCCDNNLNVPSEFLSLCPISLTQFELAMSIQVDAPLIHLS